MRTRFDQLAKGVLARLLTPLGEVQQQYEIPGEVQAADLWFRPAPGLATERARLGLVGRMAGTPCLLEPFHTTPTAGEVLDCLGKQINLRRALLRSAARRPDTEQARLRPVAPRLWILSAGRPRQVMHGLDLAPMNGWPAGFWQAPALLRMYLVVLRDLPETRDTLLLRLLGTGATFRRAMKELHALPPDAWEAELAIPLLLAFRVELFQDSGEDAMHYADELQAIYEQWEQRVKCEARDEGRKEGRDEGRKEGRLQMIRDGLAAVYEARFGGLPPALQSAIASVDSEEVLRQWLAPFATRTAEDIAALVRAG